LSTPSAPFRSIGQECSKHRGDLPDGCGETELCGTCAGYDTCGGGGTDNVCGGGCAHDPYEPNDSEQQRHTFTVNLGDGQQCWQDLVVCNHDEDYLAVRVHYGTTEYEGKQVSLGVVEAPGGAETTVVYTPEYYEDETEVITGTGSFNIVYERSGHLCTWSCSDTVFEMHVTTVSPEPVRITICGEVYP